MIDNVIELVSEKENQFMNVTVMPYPVGVHLNDYNLDYSPVHIEDLTELQSRLNKCFISHLLTDHEFLSLNVISHFHTKDDSHIFGLQLLSVHEPCACCGDVVSDWYGLKIDDDSMSLDYFHCHDFESVQDSIYRGESLLEVKDLIVNHFPQLLDESVNVY